MMSGQSPFRLLCATVALMWTEAGCTSPDLPAGPSELETGIVIYAHANFQGDWQHFTSDVPALGKLKADDCLVTWFDGYDSDSDRSWDHCMSSVHVAPGWRATLYSGANFTGASLELREDAPNLQLMKGPCRRDDDWNDCTTSIRVRRQ